MSENITQGPASAKDGILTTLLDILRTRLQILGVDLEEQIGGLTQTLILALAAAGLTVMGMTALALLATLWLWEVHRALAVAFVLLFLMGGGALCAWGCWRRLRRGPRPFATSIAELSKDLERLRSGL